MRSILYCSVKQLKKNKIMSVILIIQILICTSIFIKLTGSFQNHAYRLQIANQSFNDARYISLRLSEIINDKDESFGHYNMQVDKGIEKVRNQPGVQSIIPVAKSLPVLDYMRSNNYTMYGIHTIMYNRALLSKLHIPLSAGAIWDNEKTYTINEEIPIIISPSLAKEMPLNSVQEIRIDHLQLQNKAYTEDLTMRFRVVGILNKRNLCWHFWGMGVTIAEGLEAQNDYVIMPELAMDHGSELGYYQAPGAFIQMDDDKVHIDQFKTWANSQGMEAQELSELMKQAWKDTFELVKLDLVMFVIMFVISLTGIGGNNGLVRQSNEKDFGVYFICGADWRQCVWIDTVRNLFLVLLPGAIAIIYQFIKYELDPLQPFLLNGWTVLAVVVMLALVFVISSLGFILRTRREKPVNIIGRWE